MRYVSTRGDAPVLGFADVLLTGLARDGGLYVPVEWPRLSADQIAGFRGRPYANVAETVLAPFVGDDIAPDALRRMIDDAYGTFRHPAIAPLLQVAPNQFILELFHGPTLAFKDVAMQLLARMMDHVLAARGARATIVGATSGDTGGAAIDAFRLSKRVDIFILFPDGRVSDVQRRQMTTVGGDNIHALAIDGTFDDCQALVKGMFNNHAFRDQVALSGVNSINWARIMAQAVYYFTSATTLGAPERTVSYSVPTGNFGDVLAGHVAKHMGLTIDRLVVATNVNDILRRALETGRYDVGGVEKTQSPSMDIQVSSNFERLLFEAGGRDAATVARQMDTLKQSGGFGIAGEALARIRAEYDAHTTDEARTGETMARLLADTGYLSDPHTAVGYHAAEACDTGESPMVTLATAHPAKFPDAVRAATGITPALPEGLADLMERRERMTHLANDQSAVETFIRSSSRAAALETA
ncbi:MAG: threonine synthase [Pseudomonadota bacterium]